MVEDQRWGDDSVTYYSNAGLSELRHSSWNEKIGPIQEKRQSWTSLVLLTGGELGMRPRRRDWPGSKCFRRYRSGAKSFTYNTLLNPYANPSNRYHFPLSQIRVWTWEISDFSKVTPRVRGGSVLGLRWVRHLSLWLQTPLMRLTPLPWSFQSQPLHTDLAQVIIQMHTWNQYFQNSLCPKHNFDSSPLACDKCILHSPLFLCLISFLQLDFFHLFTCNCSLSW